MSTQQRWAIIGSLPTRAAARSDYFALPGLTGYGYSWTLSDSGYLDLDITAVPSSSGGTWNVGGGGSWALGSNWFNQTVPSGGTLTFPELVHRSVIAVNLDGLQSASALVFSGSEGYALQPGTGGTFTLGTSAAAPSISVLSGSHSISAPLEIAGGGLVIAELSGGILGISGDILG